MPTTMDLSPLVNLFWNIYDRYKASQGVKGLSEYSSDLANVTGPEDVRFMMQNQKAYNLNDPQGIQYANTLSQGMLQQYKKEAAEQQTFNARKKAAETYWPFVQQNPNDPLAKYVAENPETSAALMTPEGEHVFNILMKGQEGYGQRGRTSGFQKGISGVGVPQQGKYPAMTEIEKVIRTIGAAQGATSEEIENAIGSLRTTQEKTYPYDPQVENVGRTTYVTNTPVLGAPKREAQSVAPVVHVNVPKQEETGIPRKALQMLNQINVIDRAIGNAQVGLDEFGKPLLPQTDRRKRIEVLTKSRQSNVNTLQKYYPEVYGTSGVGKVEQPQPEQKPEALPPVSQYKGKIIKNSKTGQRMKSDGKKWIEVK